MHLVICPYYNTSICIKCSSYKICMEKAFKKDELKRYEKGKGIELNEAVFQPDKLKVSYPFVPNDKNEETKTKVNNEIIKVVTNLFNKTIFLPEKNYVKEVMGFYKVHLNGANLISILFGLYTYTGGAHGITQYTSLTMDIETGTSYVFEDLFNEDTDYKKQVNELAVKFTKENNIPLIAEYKGISDKQEFYLTEDELVLYYQIYEYTPYAYGLFEIKLPYKDIETILNNEGPIKRLL